MSAASSSPLGQILVQRGVLSVEELQEALRLKESQGGSLAINLVIVGAVDDHTLAKFYRERYKVAPLSEKQLTGADRAVFSLIPDDIVYDTGILPLWREPAEFEDEEDSLIVGVIDPSETQPLEEAAFFCPLRLVPRLLTIGQMARHYQRLSGRPWKISWEKVSQRRRGHSARQQVSAQRREEPPQRVAQVTELLEQAQALDASIDAALANEDGQGLDGITVQLISVDGAEILEEEVVELTQIKRQQPKGPAVNSVAIDTTVMSTAEAEARLDALVAASVSQRRARKRQGPTQDEQASTPQPPKTNAPPDTQPVPARRSLKVMAERDAASAAQSDEALRKTLQIEVLERPSTSVTQPLEPVTPALEPLARAVDVVALEQPRTPASLEEQTELAWFSDDFDAGGDSFEKFFSAVIESSVSHEASAPQVDATLDAFVEPVPVVPEPAPAAPETVELEPAPALVEPELEPAAVEPAAVEPAAVEPDAEPAARETVELESEAAPVEPEAVEPEAVEPEAVEPEAVEPEAVELAPEPEPAPAARETVELESVPSLVPPEEAAAASVVLDMTLDDEPPTLAEVGLSSGADSIPSPEPERAAASSVSVAGLTFTLTEDDRSGAVDNDLAIARRKLSECSDRDEVGQLLLKFLSKRYKRVLLMSVRHGELGCWQGWNGSSRVKRGAVSFPLSAVPCLEHVMSQRVCYLGPIATSSELDTEATAAAVRGMTQAWAGDAPLSLVACPLTLRNRAVLLMVYDDGPGEPASLERRFLATMKHEAEQALERAILKRKRQVMRK